MPVQGESGSTFRNNTLSAQMAKLQGTMKAGDVQVPLPEPRSQSSSDVAPEPEENGRILLGQQDKEQPTESPQEDEGKDAAPADPAEPEEDFDARVAKAVAAELAKRAKADKPPAQKTTETRADYEERLARMEQRIERASIAEQLRSVKDSDILQAIPDHIERVSTQMQKMREDAENAGEGTTNITAQKAAEIVSRDYLAGLKAAIKNPNLQKALGISPADQPKSSGSERAIPGSLKGSSNGKSTTTVHDRSALSRTFSQKLRQSATKPGR